METMRERDRHSQGLSLLKALAQRTELRDVWFNSKSVILDGFDFHGCRFDNCQLHVSSFNFELHSCFLDEKSIIHYHGDMVKVLRLFNSRYHWVDQWMPYFAPIRHEDGTITISR